MDGYAKIVERHASLPHFEPALPTSLHAGLGFALLAAAFGLGFFFTTLPKKGVGLNPTEGLVALAASASAGFGTVFLFHAAGVHL